MIEIKNVTKTFNAGTASEHKAIDDLSLTLNEGDFITAIGSNGAGKSTLLNKLDKNLNLKTDEISYALGRGKHTTRHVELLNIYEGLVADTPGFSSIDLDSLTNEQIRDAFIEFGHNCKYRDCMHINEDECEVKKSLDNNILKSRYENYIKFLRRK